VARQRVNQRARDGSYIFAHGSAQQKGGVSNSYCDDDRRRPRCHAHGHACNDRVELKRHDPDLKAVIA